MKLCSLILSGLFAGLCGSALRAGVVEVQVFDFDFSVNSPNDPILDASINVGDTVRWVWVSGLHSTTSVAGLSESWESKLTSPPFSFEHTFTNTGDFPYFCLLHGFDNGDGTADGMAGVITVVPEPATLAFIGAGAIGLALKRRRAH